MRRRGPFPLPGGILGTCSRRPTRGVPRLRDAGTKHPIPLHLPVPNQPPPVLDVQDAMLRQRQRTKPLRAPDRVVWSVHRERTHTGVETVPVVDGELGRCQARVPKHALHALERGAQSRPRGLTIGAAGLIVLTKEPAVALGRRLAQPLQPPPQTGCATAHQRRRLLEVVVRRARAMTLPQQRVLLGREREHRTLRHLAPRVAPGARRSRGGQARPSDAGGKGAAQGARRRQN
eukprot:scaffold3448_cov107-Isochrysis_galbana.AAC.12